MPRKTRETAEAGTAALFTEAESPAKPRKTRSRAAKPAARKAASAAALDALPEASGPVGLDLERAREIFERLRGFATSEALEAEIQFSVSELTRFANNIIHQNVAEEGGAISVRALIDGRMARASTNRFDDDSLRNLVLRVEELTRLQEPDPDALPMPGPQVYPRVQRFSAETARITPQDRAERVREMIAVAEAEGLTTAGIVSTSRSAQALFNTEGLEAWHCETGAEFSVTMIGENSSGWAKGSAVRWSEIDPVAGARRAAEKARLSTDPIELPPGRYTVILEPAAVLDLLGFLFWDFGGLSVLDQRSFLSGRVGKQLFGPNIHVMDDVTHPLQSGAPFDGEGMPRKRVMLVEHGFARNLVYSRQTAKQMAAAYPELRPAPTGHGFPLPNEFGEAPLNLVVAGGDSNLDEMIASTERGILVTRLWYIREVDPYKKILTGMTRDGTFLIENGALRAGVRNFRFNQDMVEMLNQVEALGPVVRTSGEESIDMAVPAMKVRGFNFTEVTRF